MANPTPAPLPVDALDQVLKPFGESLTPPRAAYVDPDVFAWEQRHLFAGCWTCLGRADELDTQQALAGRRRGVLLRGRTARCGRSPTPAGTAATSCCRAGTSATGRRSSARTTRGPTTSTGRCSGARASGTCATSTRRVRPGRAAGRRVARLGVRPRAPARGRCRSPSTSARWTSWSRRTSRSGWCSPTGTRYEVAANWKVIAENYHECYHCPLIHPELCQVSPPDSRRQLRPAGRLGRRLDGPARRAWRRCRSTGALGGDAAARASTRGAVEYLAPAPEPAGLSRTPTT